MVYFIIVIVLAVALLVYQTQRHLKGSPAKRAQEMPESKSGTNALACGGSERYLSPEKLGICPGELKYKIYNAFCSGKTSEQIYDELLDEAVEVSRGEFLRFIERFHKKMKENP